MKQKKSKTSKRVVAFSFVFVCLTFLVGCFDDNGTGKSSFDQSAFLSHYANNIIVPRYESFVDVADSFRVSVESFVESPNESGLQNIQVVHKNLFLAWQKVRIFNFGPANTLSLGSNTNVFPVDTSLIEENISVGSYDFDIPKYSKSKGLAAIDYLLNGSVGESVSAWTTDSTASERREYLVELTSLIDSLANKVLQEWTSEGGNYQKTFVENTGNSVGSSLGILINEFVKSYEFIKTEQVGNPTGISLTPLGVAMTDNPYPNRVEALYGEFSLDLVKATLTAHKDFFTGKSENNENTSNTISDTLGLDDYLKDLDAKKGNDDLHTVILNQFQEAQDALNAITGTLQASLLSDRDAVRTAWIELQNQVVNLKVEMTSALAVSITYQDSDGD